MQLLRTVPSVPTGAARVVLLVALCLLVWSGCEPDGPAVAPDLPGAGDDVVPVVAVEPGDRPEVRVGEDSPPTELVIEEITVGDGPRVDEETEVVTVHVLAHGWSSGAVITSSWDRGAPRTVSVDGAIEGFRRGIVGMAVGERRRITIPPELGYGESHPSQLEEDEPIVFIVELLGVE